MITPLRLWPSLRAHPDIRLHVCDSAGLLALLRQAEFDLADQLCWLRWVAAEDTGSLAIDAVYTTGARALWPIQHTAVQPELQPDL